MIHQDTAAPRQTPLTGERDGRTCKAPGSTKAVIDEHIQRFRQGDLEGLLDDYAEHAVMFTPSGLLKGRSEIKALFQALLAEFAKSGSSDTCIHRDFPGRLCHL